MSLSDFYPKRFALNYDPPMISKLFSISVIFFAVIEYLVPSTGKLYHHKMKLKRLNGQSTVKETISYLRKTHPLYMLPSNKISQSQISDLIERLIYRIKQNESMSKGIEKENNIKTLVSKH